MFPFLHPSHAQCAGRLGAGEADYETILQASPYIYACSLTLSRLTQTFETMRQPYKWG